MKSLKAAPLKITLVFLASGLLWILSSDLLLARLNMNPADAVILSICKGCAFMAIAAVFLYRHIRGCSEHALTERNQEEFQAIFRALPDIFFRLDRDGLVLDYKAGALIDSFAGDRQVIGRNVSDLLPAPAFDQFRKALQHLWTGNGVASFEFIRPLDAGEEYFEARLIPFKGDQIIVLVRNITERKRAEKEIRMLNDDLQRRAVELQIANHELESFSYSVSHDLRTPLRHIDGFSKALQEDCSEQLTHDGKTYVQRVRLAALRMGELIDDMLKLANVTSCELNRQRVNLSAIASAVARELRQAQPERCVKVNIAENIWANGDPSLLRVVLSNLLENAWKYTGQQETAHIDFGADCGDEVVYYVRDNGAGFDMTYADKLFTAFQRLHGIEEFEGNGIGLATVQRVIRRHGGRAWGEGAIGKGAVFYFTLGQNDA